MFPMRAMQSENIKTRQFPVIDAPVEKCDTETTNKLLQKTKQHWLLMFEVGIDDDEGTRFCVALL